MPNIPNLPLYIGITAAVVFLAILFMVSYIKAAPDEVIIISGFRKLRTIIGHAGLKIPFLERADHLSLRLIPIDVKTNAVPTKDYINVTVDAIVNAKVSDNPVAIQKAAQNFLNKNTEQIKQMIVDVLEGNMREIVGQMNLVDMISDRKQVSEKVLENAIPDLDKLGIIIKTFNIQNFSDDGKVIENLGVDKAVAIQKAASISRANAERDVKIAQAEAAKSANDAQVKANLEIAQKQNDLEVKKADLKRISDTQKAIADAAYKIQEQEQLKTINITAAEAEVAKQEKEIEIRERVVAVTQKELEAKITKQAEAEKTATILQSDAALYAKQKQAEAALYERQKKSDAEKYEQERTADAARYGQEQNAVAIKTIAAAEYEAAVNKAKGIAATGEAEGRASKLKGEGDAAAVKAKGLAEAEALDKKADAMAKYGEAAKQDMQLDALKTYFAQLPAIAGAVAKPMENIGNITMYGEGNTAKLTGDITKTISQITNGLTDSLGIDPKVLLSSLMGSRLAGVGSTNSNAAPEKKLGKKQILNENV